MHLSGEPGPARRNNTPGSLDPLPVLDPGQLEARLTATFTTFQTHPEFAQEFSTQAVNAHLALSRVLEIFKALPVYLQPPDSPKHFNNSSSQAGKLLLESRELLTHTRQGLRDIDNERIWGKELAGLGSQLRALVEDFVLTQNDFARQRNRIVQAVRDGQINWGQIKQNGQSTDPDVVDAVLRNYNLGEGQILGNQHAGNVLVRCLSDKSLRTLSIRNHRNPRFRGREFSWMSSTPHQVAHIGCKSGDRIVYSQAHDQAGNKISAWCWLQEFLAEYRGSGASILDLVKDDGTPSTDQNS